MSMYDAIGTVKASLLDYMQRLVFGLIRFTYYVKSSADGTKDAVEGFAVAGTEPLAEDAVRRMSTWGVRSVPPKGVAALVLRPGSGATNPVVVACESGRFGPSGLSDGETALYSKNSVNQVYLKNDGSIVISTASGKDLTLNAGSLKVARVSDAVIVGTLAGTVAAGGGPVTFTFTPTGADGVTPGTPVVGATVTIAAVIANSAGASNVKA